MIIASGCEPAPSTSATTAAAAAATSGTTKLRRRFAAFARRQAISGPIPDSSTSTSASGTVSRSNIGGPNECRRPVSASEISGKKVPHQITAHISTSTRLLNRNAASRENSESRR